MTIRPVRDPQVRQWLQSAGKALSDWIIQNGKFPHEVAQAVGLEYARLVELIRGTNTFVPNRDAEAFGRLYWLTGQLEALDPTRIPLETRNPDGPAPIVIPRALSQERLQELRSETSQTPKPPEKPVDPPPNPADAGAADETGTKKVHSLLQQLETDLRGWLSANGYQTGVILARELGIAEFDWYKIINGRPVMEKYAYAKICARTGLESANPTVVPPGHTWKKKEWDVWLEDNASHYASSITRGVAAAPPNNPSQGGDVDTDKIPADLETGDDESGHPLAVAARTAIQNYCREHHIHPANQLPRKLGVPESAWKHIAAGHSFTNPLWYAEVYLETGLPELDPRGIPPPKMHFSPSSGRRDPVARSWEESTWNDWLNGKPVIYHRGKRISIDKPVSQERRERFLQLIAKRDARASDTQPPPETASHTPSSSSPQSGASKLLAGLSLILEGLSDNIAEKVVEQLTSDGGTLRQIVAEAVASREDTLPPPETRRQRSRPNNGEDFASLAQRLLGQLTQLREGTAQERDVFVSAHLTEISTLWAALNPLTLDRERREESIGLEQRTGGIR